MTSSNEYRRQLERDMQRHGDVDSLASAPETEYDSFDDFARRSSRDERRQIFGRSFHPDRIPTQQMEPDLQRAIAQIKPNERDDVAREFFQQLKRKGIGDRELEQQLGLSTHHPNRMTAEDVSRLAAFAYHNHPDIFQEVLADQPAILKFLSNPIVGAALGAVAAKWLGRR